MHQQERNLFGQANIKKPVTKKKVPRNTSIFQKNQ